MKTNYARDHKLAKFIVMTAVVATMVANRHFDSVLLDILSVAVWFYGVNPVAYLIEKLRGHEHEHDII